MELVGNDTWYENVNILARLASRKRRVAFWLMLKWVALAKLLFLPHIVLERTGRQLLDVSLHFT